MERNENNLNPGVPQSRPAAAQEGMEINPMDLLRVALKRWPYIVGCVALALVVAYIYVHRTAPMYQRVATVLIKDKNSGNRTPSEAQLFKEVGLMNLGSNVENEILIFRSQYLAETVVRQLNLDVRYQVEGFWRKHDLYGISPVTVQFMEGAELGCSFRLRLMPEKKQVELYDIRYKDEELAYRKAFALGDSVATPVGALRVLPTAFLTDFDAGREILVSKMPVTLMASSLSGRIGAGKASKEASMIQLSIQDEVPQRAEDILNTLMEAYKADIVQDKNTVARNTERFVVERLAVLEKELGQVDSKIASFRSENLLLDAAQSGAYLQKADQYQSETVQLQTEMELTKYLKSYILQPKHDGELIPMNTGVTETNLNSLVGEYNKLRLQCDKLEGQSADNPVVLDLQQSMKALRGSILRTLDNHIKGLQMRMASTQKQEARSQNKASDIPNQQKIVLSVERQQKVKEQLYVYLLQKREENALAEYIAESNARVVDHAKGSNMPVAPKTQMIYLAALVLGLGLPLGIIFVALMLDTKVRSRKDIKEAVKAPFLGDIPYNKAPKDAAHGTLAVSADGMDAVTEAFRMLRTNLTFMVPQAHQVVMFTSMNPNAGKTFVITNLAAMMAYAGKKVLLIDLDIRKGTMTRQLGGQKQTGITHYLAGMTDDVRALVHPLEACPGLDVIYRGIVAPNPAELLLSERLDRLVETLKTDYDYIFVDNVPVAVVADAAITNRLADMTVFVLRAGVLDKRQLPDVEHIYREGKLKKMAVMLNGVRAEHSGYGAYGHSGTGYGYGYLETKKKRFGIF